MAVAKASVKIQRISARKARLVADLVRGKGVAEAMLILQNTNKKATKFYIKLLNSAIANAVNNHGMNAERLFISKIVANEGPTLKRYQPISKGRANPIFKRTSHMLIEVSER